MSALFSVSDYTAALAALRPRGRVWPDDPNSQQVQTLGACAPSFNRLDAAAQGLLVDAFPSSTVDLLPQWQASLALPDYVIPTSTAQAQAQVVEKLTDVGGQSRAFFIARAAELGFTITITTFSPFKCGQNGCGDQVGGVDWSFVWEVTITANTGGLPQSDLLAEFQALAPAETTVLIAS